MGGGKPHRKRLQQQRIRRSKLAAMSDQKIYSTFKPPDQQTESPTQAAAAAAVTENGNRLVFVA
jgi:hypothetical protein